MKEFRNIIIAGRGEYVIGTNYENYKLNASSSRQIKNSIDTKNYDIFTLKAVNLYIDRLLLGEDYKTISPVIIMPTSTRKLTRDILCGKFNAVTEDEMKIATDFKNKYCSLIGKIVLLGTTDMDKSRTFYDKKAYKYATDILYRMNQKIEKLKSREKNKKLFE